MLYVNVLSLLSLFKVDYSGLPSQSGKTITAGVKLWPEVLFSENLTLVDVYFVEV